MAVTDHIPEDPHDDQQTTNSIVQAKVLSQHTIRVSSHVNAVYSRIEGKSTTLDETLRRANRDGHIGLTILVENSSTECQVKARPRG